MGHIREETRVRTIKLSLLYSKYLKKNVTVYSTRFKVTYSSYSKTAFLKGSKSTYVCQLVWCCVCVRYLTPHTLICLCESAMSFVPSNVGQRVLSYIPSSKVKLLLLLIS